MNWKKIWLETKFTYLNYVKSGAFRIILFIGVILIVGIVNIDFITEQLFDDEHSHTIGVYVDERQVDSSMFSAYSSEDVEFKILNDENPQKNIEALDRVNPKYDAIMVFDDTTKRVGFHYNAQIDSGHLNEFVIKAEQMAKVFQLSDFGLDQGTIVTVIQENVDYFTYNDVDKATINLFANLIIFFTMFIYVVHIGNIIIEEKTSKISETLLSYISPLEMLIGKLIGMFGVLFTHLSAFVLIYLISINVFDSYEIYDQIVNAFNAKTLVMMLAMLIVGYITYGFLYAANSSYVDTVQDAGSASIVQSVILVIAFYIALILQMHFDATIAEIMKFTPFFSIFSNIVLTSVTDPSWGKISLIILIQIVYAIIIGLICAKKFRKGITKYCH